MSRAPRFRDRARAFAIVVGAFVAVCSNGHAEAATCGGAKLISGATMTPDPPPLAKPAKGVELDEPNFHTCLRRVTDHAAEGIEGYSRSDYSRREPYNADGSLFFTNAHNGAWYLYDAKTLKNLGVLKTLHGDAEPQWDPKSPTTLYYGERNGGLVISAVDVKSGATRVVIDLHGKLPWKNAARAWTKSEGSPSRDARYWGFQVETDDFKILGFAIWDVKQNKLTGTIDTKDRPDHVSMSPSGRWLVASGSSVIAYSRDFKTQRQVAKHGEHSDIAVCANGHDCYASIDYDSNEGWIYFFDIDTGTRTDLLRTYFNSAAAAMHFSGKAFDKPGWVLISTYKPGGPKQWYFDKIFAMELEADPRIYQLGNHRSNGRESYAAEPQAVVNHDFTRILFDSNWDATTDQKKPGGQDVDAYEIRLPKNAFP
ncbi:MAG TPA: hypothetical protein VHJ20_09755 [Polyangia bacterium]|nr:hypothetical protein [Polyangia bacterium]